MKYENAKNNKYVISWNEVDEEGVREMYVGFDERLEYIDNLVTSLEERNIEFEITTLQGE